MNQHEGITFFEQPVLDAPPLLVMLQGWIDASGVASAAAQSIENSTDIRTIATFDSDLFIDYRARRPVMQLRDGISEKLVWPQIELKAGHDESGRDFLLLTGFEPDNNWQRFAALAAEVGIGLGAKIMVGLGAYPYATPHTRAS
ncbi:MAG: PAC2 family protein, partial [Actinobacteria bacterium]|nr:PAC2 family protein [Actinomycetota bacterium]